MLRFRKGRPQAPDSQGRQAVTEAEQTIQRALHELRLQKGNGAWNLNQIQHILEQGTNERATL